MLMYIGRYLSYKKDYVLLLMKFIFTSNIEHSLLEEKHCRKNINHILLFFPFTVDLYNKQYI